MGDFWSGETDYDRNADERARERAAQERARLAEANKDLNNALTNPGKEWVNYGNSTEQQELASNLSQVGVQTGQSAFQTGAQQQQGLNMLQDRIGGGDAVATHMMGQRNRNMAAMGRSLAGKKVAGTVAGAAMMGAQESADKSIASQKQGFGRQNYNDLMKYVGKQQKVEGEAIASAKDMAKASEINVDAGEGISVICTELHRQGILSTELYQLDTAYGWALSIRDPYAYIGYIVWGSPVARAMKTSPLLTKVVSTIVLPYAKHIGGETNFLGKATLAVGLPLCHIIGRLYVHNPFRKKVNG
jgi:hypothetical protein